MTDQTNTNIEEVKSPATQALETEIEKLLLDFKLHIVGTTGMKLFDMGDIREITEKNHEEIINHVKMHLIRLIISMDLADYVKYFIDFEIEHVDEKIQQEQEESST